jgi:protein ImuB
MTRILCLWLPNWAIQRAIRCRLELKGRPVALVAAGARGKVVPRAHPAAWKNTAGHASSGTQNMPSIVAACCDRAVAQGVRPGMPLAEAQALVRDLDVAAYDAAADRRALVKLAEACERFSPRVAVEEGDEPESLLLDISNLEHLYGSEAKLVGQAKKFFTRRGYQVRVAVAETVGAAWAAARFQQGTRGWGLGAGGSRESRVESRGPEELVRGPWSVVRNKNATDNGQWTKSPVSSPQSPAPLPLEALRIADDTAALLRELGIETVDQLLALPREELTSRFGGELLRRLDQLTGRGRELIEPHRGRAALAASYALEEPTGDRGVLMQVLGQLVDQLTGQLVACDEGAVVLVCLLHLVGSGRQPPALSGVLDDNRIDNCRVACSRAAERSVSMSAHSMLTSLRDESRAPVEPPAEPGAGGVYQGISPGCVLRVGLLQPSANARQLLELIELHLENVRLAGEMDRVELRAVVTGRLGERQRELFSDRRSTDPHQLAVLVNRLSSRLGYERVLRAGLRKSPVPERAVGWKPVAERKEWEKGRGGKGERSRKPRSSPYLPVFPSAPLGPRPLTLYPEPEATEVVCVAPDGPPEFVWVGRHRERIVSCVGPERIETLWWRGPSVRRDYYRVATESGGHLWMFRQLADGRWFVHGEFS